jgi:hypothetical protein
MKVLLLKAIAVSVFVSSCSIGNGAPQTTTTTIDPAVLLADKVSAAKASLLLESSFPTAEEVGATFRDLGLWGQVKKIQSTAAVALSMRTRRTVCNGFGFDEIVRQYAPTRSVAASFEPNFDGVSEEEMAKVSKYGLLTISIFDIGSSSISAPYNSVVDRFALQNGACDVKMAFGFGKCPLVQKDRDPSVKVPVNEFGWTEDKDVASFSPQCEKATTSFDMVATSSAIEAEYIDNGFKIVLQNAIPKNASGGVLARSTHFFPQQDLGLLFLVELTHQDGTSRKSEYPQLTSANANTTQTVVESLFTSWSRKLFTQVKLSEISSLRPANSDNDSPSSATTQVKPTWTTGANPFADLNEAPYVQTACDIFRKDLPNAIGKDDLVKIAITTLRGLEKKYGLDAKEKANNQNLTYQDIWSGVSALIAYYDDYSTDFRFPATFSLTESSCVDFGFTSVNEKFSSRNGGWTAVKN